MGWPFPFAVSARQFPFTCSVHVRVTSTSCHLPAGRYNHLRGSGPDQFSPASSSLSAASSKSPSQSSRTPLQCRARFETRGGRVPFASFRSLLSRPSGTSRVFTETVDTAGVIPQGPIFRPRALPLARPQQRSSVAIRVVTCDDCQQDFRERLRWFMT